MLKIYKASAGSGKTFTLTKEYLKLLLGYCDPETGRWRLRKKPDGANRNILAITFTNKATDEMTRRIIKELATLGGREPSGDNNSPYMSDFCTLFGATEAQIRQLASLTLDDLLADFVFFHVSTIDAFFQNVLRIFAREVEMPDDFKLELDNAYTISIGVNEMFSSINRGVMASKVDRELQSWLQQWLTKFLQDMFEEGKATNLFSRKSNPFNGLVSTFSRLMDEHFKINSQAITEYLSDTNRLLAFESGLGKETEAVTRQLTELSNIIRQYGDYQMVNRFIRNRIEQWAAGDMKLPSDTLINGIDDVATRFSAAAVRAGNIPSDLDLAVQTICSLSKEYADISARNEVIVKSINSFGLLGCLLHHITRYCKGNNLMLLSETTSLLREIINDDDTPFVYERLGYYLRHFLIDEFQDTSRMQWDNLRPLVMESLSHSHNNLIIGDEKQCIYRFRNSDPSLLGHEIGRQVEEVYGDEALKVEGTAISQNNNWRSSREVVTFNNSIFHALASIIGDEETYSNVIQQISDRRDKDIPGHVSLIFESKDLPGDESHDDTDDDQQDSPEKNRFALRTMVNEVGRLLDAGYRQEDISILVRTHSEGEAVINRLLSCSADPDWKHGSLKVTSTDSVGVGSSSAVKMIIEILRLTQMPQIVKKTDISANLHVTTDVVNPAYKRARLLYCFEYYRHQTIDDGEGNMRTLKPEEALAHAIEALRDDRVAEKEALDGNYKEIYELLYFVRSHSPASDKEGDKEDDTETPSNAGKIASPTLSTMVDDIISHFVPPEVLPQATIYLTAFQDLVYDFCQRGNSDIRSFLEWWDRTGNRAGISSTDASHAINVMTIHASKGLEFPCVIIPFANWDLVKYNSTYIPSTKWFRLDHRYFPTINPQLVPPMIPLEFTSRLASIKAFSKQAEAYEREQRIDSLNVAYVAFTRAVNELVVISPMSKEARSMLKEKKGKKKDKETKSTVNSLDLLLKGALRRLTSEAIAADTTLTDESRRWIIPLGDESAAEAINVGRPTRCKADEKPSEPLPDHLPVYEPNVNNSLLAISRAEVEVFDFDDARCRGEFLHKVMSCVRYSGDLPLALRRAAYRARLTPDQSNECLALLSRALAQPGAAKWFEGFSRVLTEYTITTSEGQWRPDRVVWTADGHIDVIDFKFGGERRSYDRQVSNYVELLRHAGYPSVRGFLWYIEEELITQVI